MFFTSLMASGDMLLLVLGRRFLSILPGMLICVPVSLHAFARREKANG